MKEEKYDFIGKHLMINYMDCNPLSINDIKNLENTMKIACENAKATVLSSSSHLFPINNSSLMGVSIVIILSESHASIHTYPEHNSCFVDFFTCGNNCLDEEFEATLRNYLKPKKIISKLFLRESSIIKEHLIVDQKPKPSKINPKIATSLKKY